MKPLGDAFIKMIKMIIAPIIFCTVVHGIASMQDMKKVGRVGLKALIYFEVLTTHRADRRPHRREHPAARRRHERRRQERSTPRAIQGFVAKSKEQGTLQFLMDIIPNTVVGAFASGEILQVLFFAILFAFGLQALGERGKALLNVIDQASYALFGVVGIIMKVAPIGAFGAMAFTIGKYGVVTLLSLAKLMVAFYVTCIIFVVFVLGFFAWLAGFNIFKFIRYIKEELLIVLGTSSSESVLPRMIAKMENLGCEKSVVGLVIPTGYSFNLDGTCIYLTMAALFLAQATGTRARVWPSSSALSASCCLTSKGAAGVTGSGFIVLAATLASVGTIPVAVDRAHPGRRPLHVGSARAHQPDRQRRRDRRGLEMGRRARCRAGCVRISTTRPRPRPIRPSRCWSRTRSRRRAAKARDHVNDREPDMTRALLRIAAILIAVLGLPGAGRSRGGAIGRSTLTIGTASPGGTYHAYGEGLARLLTRKLGLPVCMRETEGPVENLKLLETGEVQLAFVTLGIAQQGWNGTRRLDRRKAIPQRAGAVSDVRHAVPVHRDVRLRAFSRSPISPGKQVGIGPQGGTGGVYTPAGVQGDQDRRELRHRELDRSGRSAQRAQARRAGRGRGRSGARGHRAREEGQYSQSGSDAEPDGRPCAWRCRRSRRRSSRPAPIRRCGATIGPSACTISPSRAPICPTTLSMRSSMRCSTIPTR